MNNQINARGLKRIGRGIEIESLPEMTYIKACLI
jgi:hypothetical protein